VWFTGRPHADHLTAISALSLYVICLFYWTPCWPSHGHFLPSACTPSVWFTGRLHVDHLTDTFCPQDVHHLLGWLEDFMLTISWPLSPSVSTSSVWFTGRPHADHLLATFPLSEDIICLVYRKTPCWPSPGYFPPSACTLSVWFTRRPRSRGHFLCSVGMWAVKVDWKTSCWPSGGHFLPSAGGYFMCSVWIGARRRVGGIADYKGTCTILLFFCPDSAPVFVTFWRAVLFAIIPLELYFSGCSGVLRLYYSKSLSAFSQIITCSKQHFHAL